ncbi:MAG: alpha/beta hydrolase [Pseudomonadota bacterium]
MDLSDAYAVSRYIPNAESYRDRWSRQGAAFRDALGDRAELAVPYGDSPRQIYDLFRPETALRGTVIFVHGGYWRSNSPSDWSWLAAGPLAHGWAVAMPGYDLCPAVRISDITRQVAAAIEAISTRGAGPVSLAGHSAGGHLVSRMLDPDILPKEVRNRLTCVVPISPLGDLRPILQTDMNADLRLDAREAEAESPIFMQNRHPVPVTVLVGGQERPVFLDQARWMSEAWGIEQIIDAPRHHFDVIDALADPQSDLTLRLIGG